MSRAFRSRELWRSFSPRPAGVGAIGKVPSGARYRWPSVPRYFAAQQAIEGTLPLALGNESLSRWSVRLANAFMFSALVVWPLWAPLAAMLVERDRLRRLAMIVILIVAIPLAVRGVSGMSAHLYEACVVHNSISYSNGWPYLPRQFAAYVLCASSRFCSRRTGRCAYSA